MRYLNFIHDFIISKLFDTKLSMYYVSKLLSATYFVVISECPDGAVCHSLDVRHYSVFRHSLLANIIAGIRSEMYLMIPDSTFW